MTLLHEPITQWTASCPEPFRQLWGLVAIRARRDNYARQRLGAPDNAVVGFVGPGDADNARGKIAEGVAAHIHARAPSQVVKLFKANLPRRTGEHEAITRAVFAVGGPAPKCTTR